MSLVLDLKWFNTVLVTSLFVSHKIHSTYNDNSENLSARGSKRKAEKSDSFLSLFQNVAKNLKTIYRNIKIMVDASYDLQCCSEPA